MNFVIKIKSTAKLSRVDDVYEQVMHLKDIEDDVIESIEMAGVEL